MKTIKVPDSADGMRLDVYLLQIAPNGTTRGVIQRAVKEGKISVDEKQKTKPGNTISKGQNIRIADDAFALPTPPQVKPDQEIPLTILHEDPELIAISKQPGIAVHAGVKNEHPTIADALLSRYPDLKNIGEDPLRPGIVHRLDKDTSGVMLVARTPEMFQYLKKQFQGRRVHKKYLALVRGVMGEEDGRINQPIIRSTRNPMRRTVAKKGEGREAITNFRRAEKFSHYTLLEVAPLTGRTHQIRVHLSHLGFPIVGDNLYGKQSKDSRIPAVKRHFLHAFEIHLPMPDGKIRVFRAPLALDLQEILDQLRANKARQKPAQKKLVHKAYRTSQH